MAYARLPDCSSESSGYEKEEQPSKLSHNINRYLLYRNLFGTCFVLWVTTSATLVWALVHKSTEHHNHAVGLLPFAPGILRGTTQ
jgi:hypothetical protein